VPGADVGLDTYPSVGDNEQGAETEETKGS
jgi:hypothetical protein